MSKKDYILKVLDALEPQWPIAKWLKILVEWNTLDDVSIESLIDIFKKMIEETKDEETKNKLQKSKDILEKLQTLEREQHLRDETSLKELDKMIEAL